MTTTWEYPKLHDRAGDAELRRHLNEELTKLRGVFGVAPTPNWVNVRKHGAQGDGVRNDTAAFTRAVSQANAGDVLYVPAGTYLIDPVTITKVLHLRLDPGATLKANSLTTSLGLVTFQGSLSATATTLTVGATAGDLELSVTSETGFAAGNWVRVEDSGAAATAFEYEFARVLATASGKLYLQTPLEVPVTYPASADGDVTLITALEGITVVGGTWDGNSLGGTNVSLLQFDYCFDTKLADCTFTNFDYTAVDWRNGKHLACIGVNVLDSSADLAAGTPPDAGYGINPRLGSAHLTVTGGLFRGLRHAVIVSEGAHHVTVVGNTFHAMYSSPLDTHFRRQLDVVFSGNVISGDTYRQASQLTRSTVGYGISVSVTDTRVVIANNTISNTRGAGIRVSKSSLDESYVTVAHNVLTDCFESTATSEASIYLARVQNFSVTGNVVKRTDSVAIPAFRCTLSENGAVVGNAFGMEGTYTGLIACHVSDSKRVSLTGNVARIASGNAASSAFRCTSTGAGDTTLVELVGNIAEVAGGAAEVTVDANCTSVQRIGNSWNAHTLAGTLTATDLTATNDVSAGADVNATGDFIGASDLILTGATSRVTMGASGPSANTGIYLRSEVLLSGSAAQRGVQVDATFDSSATSVGDAIYARGNTEAASFTMSQLAGLHIADAVEGAGSTITTQIGLLIDDQTKGGTNIAMKVGTGNIGFHGVTPVARPSALTQTYSTADRTLSAYTSDPESSAYTGVDNLQVGSVYATVADLNQLRVAYENLRAHAEDLAQFVNALVDDMQANGLEQ